MIMISSLFMRTLRTNDTQIYSGVSGGITYTIQYVRDIDIVRVSLPGRASESITDFKGYYWYNFMEYIENINACDDVFSEYCFDDENISVQPERINTPGISDLDSDIDLSGISFIQRETNQCIRIKICSCRWRWILSVKSYTGFKNNMIIHGRWSVIRCKRKFTTNSLKWLIKKRSRLLLIRHSIISGKM